MEKIFCNCFDCCGKNKRKYLELYGKNEGVTDDSITLRMVFIRDGFQEARQIRVGRDELMKAIVNLEK